MNMKEFKEWLDSGSLESFVFSNGQGSWQEDRFIRVAKNEDIDLLFELPQLQFPDRANVSGKAFYIGFYNRKIGKLYDCQYRFRHIYSDSDGVLPEWIEESLLTKEAVEVAVSNAVNEIIDNDRTNLSITEISDMEKRHLDEGMARNQARRLFLELETNLDSIPFSCEYRLREPLTETEWILCYTDMSAFARQRAEKYIGKYQEDILKKFQFNDMVWKYYQEIEQNPDSLLHIAKKIRYAVEHASAKYVNVTICKKGIEGTFKTDAQGFRRLNVLYYDHDMPAKDRQKFQDLFGRHAFYYPNEIVKITYGKKTLYENELAAKEKSVEKVNMSYGEMVNYFRCAERQGQHLNGFIVFSQDSFTEEYSVESRTYVVSSDNKAFRPNMSGNSIYGSSLDGKDVRIRLEQYMALAHGGENGWEIECCYMMSDELARAKFLTADMT